MNHKLICCYTISFITVTCYIRNIQNMLCYTGMDLQFVVMNIDATL